MLINSTGLDGDEQLGHNDYEKSAAGAKLRALHVRDSVKALVWQ